MLESDWPEEQAPVRPGRQSERVSYEAAVQFRKGHTRVTVRIVDISTTGARLAAVHHLREGDSFWLKLPGLEPQEAIVVWADDFIIGCRFVHPLHASIFENLFKTG